MKRPFSLLEITIGLVLTTLLLSSLFSCFRHLLHVEALVEKERKDRHWEYVTQMRLNRIFEAIPTGSVFSIEPYGDKIQEALHFTFHNGVDPDPHFCQEVEGYLGVTGKKNFCLFIEPKSGKERKEVFLKNVERFSIQFLDPKDGTWTEKWEKNSLPPLVKISLSKKEFFFVVANGKSLEAAS